MTEFLSKSLVAAGVLLAIPTALSVYFAAYLLWKTWPWQQFPSFLLGWLAFCSMGFLLLRGSVRFVRSPQSVRRPRLLWLGVAAYLAGILAASITWVVSVYRDALYQDNSPEAFRASPGDLLVPALFLIIPAWAFLLSIVLSVSRQRA